MITNAEMKRIRSLQEKKYRDSLGLFVVEGEKMVQEALNSDFQVESVWKVEEIGEKAMKAISGMTTPSPVLAVLRKPALACSQAEIEAQESLCLALDGVRDPGNMGTIVRIAEWFGAGCIYTSPDCVDVFNPKVIQASMGSIFRKKVVCAPLTVVCDSFSKKGMQVYGTFLDGADIYSQELEKSGLVVMGNESNGISREVASMVSRRLYIPSYGGSGAESLNVAIATAVTLAEFRRR